MREIVESGDPEQLILKGTKGGIARVGSNGCAAGGFGKKVENIGAACAPAQLERGVLCNPVKAGSCIAIFHEEKAGLVIVVEHLWHLGQDFAAHGNERAALCAAQSPFRGKSRVAGDGIRGKEQQRGGQGAQGDPNRTRQRFHFYAEALHARFPPSVKSMQRVKEQPKRS